MAVWCPSVAVGSTWIPRHACICPGAGTRVNQRQPLLASRLVLCHTPSSVRGHGKMLNDGRETRSGEVPLLRYSRRGHDTLQHLLQSRSAGEPAPAACGQRTRPVPHPQQRSCAWEGAKRRQGGRRGAPAAIPSTRTVVTRQALTTPECARVPQPPRRGRRFVFSQLKQGPYHFIKLFSSAVSSKNLASMLIFCQMRNTPVARL